MVESDKLIFSKNVREVTFQLAGLVCRLKVENANHLELWGHYNHYLVEEVNSVPDVILTCTVDEKFALTREESPGYPSFQTKADENGVWFSRTDAEGRVSTQKGSATKADFTISSVSHSLESVIRATCSLALLSKNAFILHGSAVKTAKGAYVFAGLSEAGKSTISTLLGEIKDVTKISDELLVCGKDGESWKAYVTPFIGSKGLPFGEETKIRSMYFLKGKGNVHRCSQAIKGSATAELLRHMAVYGNNQAIAQSALDIAGQFVNKVPCYDLSFAKCTSVSNVLGLTVAQD